MVKPTTVNLTGPLAGFFRAYSDSQGESPEQSAIRVLEDFATGARELGFEC